MSTESANPKNWVMKLRLKWAIFLEKTAFLREYLWKYKKFVFFGLSALALVDSLEIILPFLLKRSVDIVTENGSLKTLTWLALSYLGISLIQGYCRYLWRMYLIRSSMLTGRDLRNRFSSHLFGLSVSFFDKHRIGDLMSLATNDVEAIRMAMGAGLLTLADAVFYISTVPIAMILLSPKLTALAFAPLILIPWLTVRNERLIQSRFRQVQEYFSKLSAMAQENLNGIRVIKAFAREDAQIERFRKSGEEFIALNLKLSKVQSAFGPSLDFVMSMGLVLLLFFGGNGVIEGTVTLGTFVAFQRYIQKMIWPMSAIGHSLTFYQKSIASSMRIKEIFSIQTDVPEPVTPLSPRSTTTEAIKGKVEFRNLSFSFPGASKASLSQVTMTIYSGERVAFIGAIGSGKSALLSLLPRLYPIQREMLFIDDIDINDWSLDELRQRVGYVSQDVFLFSDSVTENVAFGLAEWRNQPTKTDPVQEAAQLAAVHEDVLSLGEGYLTKLGERGVNLSGGQRQRLTIARALAKQPEILVLDDALSSVDVETEEKILKSLRSRPRRNTEIIAAHRISTIKDADRIVVLKNGIVQQTGSHSKLLRDKQGPYRKFYDNQRSKEDLDRFIENYEKQRVTL